MVLVVTGVGFLIHGSSVVYAHERRVLTASLANMNLFMFAIAEVGPGEQHACLVPGWEGGGPYAAIVDLDVYF